MRICEAIVHLETDVVGGSRLRIEHRVFLEQDWQSGVPWAALA